MTAESMLSKRPVSENTVAFFFVNELFPPHIYYIVNLEFHLMKMNPLRYFVEHQNFCAVEDITEK